LTVELEDQNFSFGISLSSRHAGKMKLLQFARLVCALAMVGFAPVITLRGSDLAEEYNQVRKIALKDPKVRAAFRKANDELDRRIIEIDPSLKPFVEQQRGTKKVAHSKKVTAKTTHVVAKGETLTSIARRYKLTVDRLVLTNQIAKQAPLRVGQKLIIPSVP
jgi:nucleoid-associated protein YgaU